MFSGFRSLYSDVRGHSVSKSGSVPVDYIELMKVFKGKQQLSAIKSKIQSISGQADFEYMRTGHAVHQNGVPSASDGTILHR